MQLILRDPDTIEAVLKLLRKNPALLAKEQALSGQTTPHTTSTAVRNGTSWFDANSGIEVAAGTKIRRLISRVKNNNGMVNAIIDNGELIVTHHKTGRKQKCLSFRQAEDFVVGKSAKTNVWYRWEYQTAPGRWIKIDALRLARDE